LQFALFGSAIGGVFFMMIAAQNLDINLRHPFRRNEKSDSSRDRQTAPATGS
jgi:hypothetical protein